MVIVAEDPKHIQHQFNLIGVEFLFADALDGRYI